MIYLKIESIEINIRWDDGHQFKLKSFYSPNIVALSQLSRHYKVSLIRTGNSQQFETKKFEPKWSRTISSNFNCSKSMGYCLRIGVILCFVTVDHFHRCSLHWLHCCSTISTELSDYRSLQKCHQFVQSASSQKGHFKSPLFQRQILSIFNIKL